MPSHTTTGASTTATTLPLTLGSITSSNLLGIPDFVAGSMKFWIDASDLTTLFQENTGASATTPAVLHGDPVGTIKDKSGNAKHGVADSNTYRANLDLQNSSGRPVIGKGWDCPPIDGIFPRYSVSGSTSYFKFMHSTTATIFIVFRRKYVNRASVPGWIPSPLGTTNLGGAGIYITLHDNYGANRAYTSVNNTTPFTYVSQIYSGNNYIPGNAFCVLTTRIDFTSPGNYLMKQCVNAGTELVGSNVSAPSTGNSYFDLRFGGYIGGGGADGLIDTAETIIFDTYFSDTQKTYVENYLMKKWLNLTNKLNTDDYLLTDDKTYLTDTSGNQLFWR